MSNVLVMPTIFRQLNFSDDDGNVDVNNVNINNINAAIANWIKKKRREKKRSHNGIPLKIHKTPILLCWFHNTQAKLLDYLLLHRSSQPLE